MFGKRERKRTKGSLREGPGDDVAGRREGKQAGKRLSDLFRRRSSIDEEFFGEMEDLLVESDFGAAAAVDLVSHLRFLHRKDSGRWGREEWLEAIKEYLRPHLHFVDLTPDPQRMSLYLVLGVNGVGKTTTIAKMAYCHLQSGFPGVVLAAGDTYRAAAIDQLAIHADRVGARLVRQQPGADPGAVIFDAVASARTKKEHLVLADTAGRMHNRANLIQELEKIDRIARRQLSPEDVYRKILVIDGTTGQNGLRQVETFHEAVDVDALVLTKYDSSARGGLAAAIALKSGLPFAFLGRGEGMADLVPFDPEVYLSELLDSE